MVNKHLLHYLTEMGIWTPLKNQIIYEDGSVQRMAEIPDDLKAIYKFVVQPCMLIVYQMQLLFKHLNISMQLLHQNCLGDQAENFG